MVIEPCCYQKQFLQVFSTAQQCGHASYITNSDTTIQHLLNWLLSYMPMSHITLAMTNITDPTMRYIESAATKLFYDQTEAKEQPLIRQLDIIAQAYPELTADSFAKATSQVTISKYPVGFRAILIQTDYDIRIEDGKAIKAPGRKFLVQGSLNQDIVRSMQMVTVTTDPDYTEMQQRLTPITKLHKMFSLV